MTVKQAEAAYSAARAGLYAAECEQDLEGAQELVKLAFKALEEARKKEKLDGK